MVTNIISFINMKGGVGKTTLCKEIGYYMNKIRGKTILFIDLDPQANLTQSFFRKYKYKHKNQIDDEKTKKYTQTEVSIESLFKYSKIEEVDIDEIILSLDDGLDIIPGSLNAIFTERTTKDSILEKSLYNLIKNSSLRGKYEYIFIDCPPTYSAYTVAALLPSDFYITPVKPDSYSILGIQMMKKVVADIERANDLYFVAKPLKHLGVIFTSIPKNPEIGEIQTISKIKESQFLKEKNMYIFSSNFMKKNDYFKNLSYFAVDSNSELLKENLSIIIDELEERIANE
ncbi:ParA family protein [Listeria weihenstephanensis]|uniref:ParA family protein n=1 Tax=Listeria weihenstephanensis TaxID=1006155 RepID=A0A841Z5Y0_9LIST|nr:ParA family protein [Listeria weihenstephanensis]